MKRFLIIAVLLGFSLLNMGAYFGFTPTLADIVPTPSPSPSSNLGVENLTIQKVFDIIVGIACFMIRISIAIIVIAVIFYGIKFLVSQGDPTAVGDAKRALGWAVVGILVIFGTYTIIKTVSYVVGGGGNVSVLDCS